MRMKLLTENSNRMMALLLVFVLMFVLGGLAELHQRETTLAEAMGLTQLNPEIPPAAQVQLVMLNTTVLLVSLIPAAIFNSLPAVAALAVIPFLASRFIHALYGTKNVSAAHDLLQRNVFGMTALRPLIIVQEGRIAVGGGELHDRAGGRAVLIVYNDSAAVLERGGRLTRVVGGPSFGFLEPFERVWETLDLRHQRWLFTDDAMTKDGIPISCEADITFKIDDRFTDEGGNVGTNVPQTKPVQATPSKETVAQKVLAKLLRRESPRKKTPSQGMVRLSSDKEIAAELSRAGISTPLPYTDEAVFNAATSTWVRIRQPDHEEQIRKWTGRLMIGEVEGTLRNILARYRLDWILRSPQPGQDHPREEIREQLTQRLQDTLSVGNRLGARILDVDLGRIDVKDERISTQWVEAWQAGWEQRAAESTAEGEAELARLHAAQVQAQAEMVRTLTEAIRPLVTSVEEFPSYLLAMRFVETLRWMAYDPLRRVYLPPEILRTLDELEQAVGETRVGTEGPISQTERLLREGMLGGRR